MGATAVVILERLIRFARPPGALGEQLIDFWNYDGIDDLGPRGFELADGPVKNFGYLLEIFRIGLGVESDGFAQNSEASAFKPVFGQKFCERIRNMTDASCRNRIFRIVAHHDV